MNKNLTRNATVLSSETLDAGLFVRLRFTVKNNLKRQVAVIRYRVKVLDEENRLLGYQIGEITEVKPLEIRSMDILINYDRARRAVVDRMLCFEK